MITAYIINWFNKWSA